MTNEWDEKVRKVYKDIVLKKGNIKAAQAYYGGYLICHAHSKLPEKTEQYIANIIIRDGLILG